MTYAETEIRAFRLSGSSHSWERPSRDARQTFSSTPKVATLAWQETPHRRMDIPETSRAQTASAKGNQACIMRQRALSNSVASCPV